MRLQDNVIFLPTRGRVDRQITLKKLPSVILNNVIIACHPGEEQELTRQWGKQIKAVVPMAANNLSIKRQMCMELSPTDYITFVDDSLDFHVRSDSEIGPPTKYPLKTMTPLHFTPSTLEHHYYTMFNWILTQLKTDRYGMVGISRRCFNATKLDVEVTYNERICSFWGINRKLYNTLEGHPKFSDIALKQDLYIMLHFLINGIPTVVNYTYAYGRVGNSNSKGGCSLYRTKELYEQVARQFKDMFPQFVKLHDKSTHSWVGEFDEKTIDIIIQCEKAYNYGINRNVQPKLF